MDGPFIRRDGVINKIFNSMKAFGDFLLIFS